MIDFWIGLHCPSQINTFAIPSVHPFIYASNYNRTGAGGGVSPFLATITLWSSVYEGCLRAYLLTTLANVEWYDVI